MYFYFFCEYKAVIKFQGVIYGVSDNSAKFCNLEKPYPLVEICPLNAESEPLAFYLSDEFLFNPPDNLTVTDLKGGYFLRFEKKEKKGDFKIIRQEKFRDSSITAFCENGYKISLDTQSDFYAETLGFSPLSAEFTRGEGVNSNLIFAVFKLNDKKILRVYAVKNPALLFSGEISEFSATENGFKVTERLRDMAKHIKTSEYFESGGELKTVSASVTAGENFDREKLPARLIPYAFAEELACGGDYTFYLAENLKDSADKLGGYLGDFIGVTPPPIFRTFDEVGLIKKLAERKYAVDYFTFETENGKITNILKK